VTENGAIQFEIKAAVSLQKDKFLRAGYSANADIILERKDSVLSVPEAVLLFEKDKPYLEIESGPGKFEKRSVRTGISDGLQTEILEGIQGNEKIKLPEHSGTEESTAE
jgi:HlyD family secretion protein